MPNKQGIAKPEIVASIILGVCVIAGVAYFATNWGAAPVQNTPLPTNNPIMSAPVSVSTYGMKKYTDAAYGFSFWYPSALRVTATATSDSTGFPGGIAVESLQVGTPGTIMVYVVNSEKSTITDEANGHASPIAQTRYFYDSATNKWMVAFPEGTTGPGTGATTTADVSRINYSGLTMLPSGRRFDTTIIPLSTTRFLVIGDGGGSSFTPQLAETVEKVGSTINPAAQTSALQAEATAYSSGISK